MENQENKSQTLAIMIDTLEQQEKKFIDWYVWACFKFGNFYSFQIREYVYLPYSGNNVDVVLMLFEAVQKLKYPQADSSSEQEMKIIRMLAEKWVERKTNRGMILYGPVGVGKTQLSLDWIEFKLRVLAPVSGKIDRLNYSECKRIRRKKFLILSSSKLRDRFHTEEFELWSKLEGDLVYLDDIGLNNTINFFGQNINLIEELIYCFYDRFKANGLEFFATSNKLPEELKSELNLRAFSRLNEMADLEFMGGEDRRKNPEKCLKSTPNFHDIKYSHDKWCEW